jgi:hypothetical protein
LFHARSALGVRPSELCSSRTAGNRLRNPLPSCRWRNTLDSTANHHEPSQLPRMRASQWQWTAMSPLSLSRLQGLSPYESPPPREDGLDPPGHVALLGLPPSGCSPPPRWLKEPPLMRLVSRARTTNDTPLQGLTHDGIGFPLSRLPTLLGFATF